MAEIRWTEEAYRWLRDIYDYISADNPIAAQKVISGIYEKAQSLSQFPEIGYRYREEEDGEIRILLYGHYRIAYQIRSTIKIIWITGDTFFCFHFHNKYKQRFSLVVYTYKHMKNKGDRSRRIE